MLGVNGLDVSEIGGSVMQAVMHIEKISMSKISNICLGFIFYFLTFLYGDVKIKP